MAKILVVCVASNNTRVESLILEYHPSAVLVFTEPSQRVNRNFVFGDAPVDGAIVEAVTGAESWFTFISTVMGLPTTSFVSPSTTEDIRDRLRAEEKLEEAVNLFFEEIAVSEIDSVPIQSISQADESTHTGPAEFIGLLKERLICALGELSVSSPTAYTRHLVTLISTIDFPKLGNIPSSAVGISSCLYTAQMTKRLILQHFKETVTQNKPHLTPPTCRDERFPLGWEGLFPILFSIIDFIPKDDIKIEFSVNEGGNGLSIHFSTSPLFNQPPASLNECRELAFEYGNAAKRMLENPIMEGNRKLWQWNSGAGDGSELELSSTNS